MRASRLLSLLMLLQARGRASAPALAAALECSVRTVLRDIDQLSAAGVPVYAERGREGGFRLREGWSTQLTGLTDSESQALLLAGLPAAASELGLGAASASARLKVLASVPAALRDNAQKTAARLHIDPVDWYRAQEPPPFLREVAEAVWKQRPLRVRYDSWAGVRRRTLRPLGLVLKAGVWYVVALAEQASEPRTYRLSGIFELEFGKGRFAWPRKFVLADWWAASVRRFEREIFVGEATLRVSARGLRWVGEWSSAAAAAAQFTAVADEQDGWMRITIPIESEDHALRQVLGLGVEAEVLAPTALRERLCAVVTQLAANHGP